MPIFTSLLFLFLALALLPLAFRGGRVRQRQRENSVLTDRMSLGASICIAAAREAFGVELDHSIESIAELDTLVTRGWSSASLAESANEFGSGKESKELIFVLAAYLGTAFVRYRAGEWRIEHDQPTLYFRSFQESEDPFELIGRKLKEPERTNLSQETARWGMAGEPAPEDGNERPAE